MNQNYGGNMSSVVRRAARVVIDPEFMEQIKQDGQYAKAFAAPISNVINEVAAQNINANVAEMNRVIGEDVRKDGGSSSSSAGSSCQSSIAGSGMLAKIIAKKAIESGVEASVASSARFLFG